MSYRDIHARHRPKTPSLLAGAFVAVLAVLASGPGVSAQSGEPSVAQIDGATAFRHSFGLSQDLSTVRQTFLDASYSAMPYGVPLSLSEIEDLQHRLEVEFASGPAQEFALDQGGYAGVFFDQQDEGRPVFSFSTDDSERDIAIRRLLPDRPEPRIRTVSFSLKRLTATKYDIVDDIAMLWKRGVQVVGVGPSIRENTVRVEVIKPTEEARDILGEYGPEVEVVAGDVVEADCAIANCSPGKAGLGIVAPNGHTCTIGAFVKLANVSVPRMITAGHCFGLNGGPDKTWEHNSVAIANSGGNTWSLHDQPDNSPPTSFAITDAGIFKATVNAFDPDAYNKFVFWNDDTNTLAQGRLTRYQTPAYQNEESQICRTGWGSFGNNAFPPCGAIFLTDDWRWSCEGPGEAGPCAAIDHQWVVDFDTKGGDSGGPYYTPPFCDGGTGQSCTGGTWKATFRGIVTHSVKDTNATKRAWYSPTLWIMSGLANEATNVDIDWFCVGTTCPSVTCFAGMCSP